LKPDGAGSRHSREITTNRSEQLPERLADRQRGWLLPEQETQQIEVHRGAAAGDAQRVAVRGAPEQGIVAGVGAGAKDAGAGRAGRRSHPGAPSQLTGAESYQEPED